MTQETARGSSGDLAPRQLVLWLVAFATALTFYFAVVEGPGRINHDMSEAYVWGREFQWGYHQHPPLWAWICGVWFLVFPHEIAWFGLLSAVNAAIGLYGAWWATGCFVKGPKRTAALALAILTPGFSLLAFKYNANTIFISLWPFTLGFFLRALQGRRLADTIGFGVLAGFCLLSKYYALVPLSACILTSLLPDWRAAYWRSASPWLSMAIALALFSPHLVWLTHHRTPLEYLASRSGLDASRLARAIGSTALGAVAIGAPAAIAVAAIGRPRRAPAASRWRDPDFRRLVVLALAPLALTLIAGLLLRTSIYTEMLCGMYPLWPLLCIAFADPADEAKLARGATRLAFAAMAALVALAAPVSYATYRWSGRADDVAPFRDVSFAAERAWREATDAPLVYVAGTAAYEQAAAFYAADRPHAFINFDVAFSPWIDPEDVEKRGLLSICLVESPDCLERAARWTRSNSRVIDLQLAHTAWGYRAKPVMYRITVTPPLATAN
jgi:4-amino-4-deoxy-L-arabinose transferase-like glycosyltransferase